MNEQDFVELLEGALDTDDVEDQAGRIRVQTFEDAGMLTRSAGLVVQTESGEEFQVTVVRSR
jgi:hypothetical protein